MLLSSTLHEKCYVQLYQSIRKINVYVVKALPNSPSNKANEEPEIFGPIMSMLKKRGRLP